MTMTADRLSAVYTFRSPRAFTSGPLTARRPSNTSVAADGLTQQLDNIGIVEKAPDVSKIALRPQLGSAFAMCGFAPWQHF
jgi:hypothetical protein